MRILRAASSFWAKVEIIAAAILVGIITLLILLNVVTRTLNYAIYWVDEAAVYAMAWSTFLAASAAIHHSQSVSVTLVKDNLSPKASQALAKIVDLCIFIFALMMVYLCFRWFLPFEVLKWGFDIEIFQGKTFNFIYAEPTSTLGVRKFWVWLIMWIFSLGALLHSTNNLLRSHDHEKENTR